MILVKVSHYLNKSGLDYFPTWFNELFGIINKYEGYFDMEYSVDFSQSVAKIILFFQDNDKLNIWANSSKHDEIVNKLAPYKIKPLEVERFNLIKRNIETTHQQIELIGYELCPFTQRINIILTEKNISHSVTYIDLQNKPDWFIKMSPLGEIPILRIDKHVIFKSNVICEFLNDTFNPTLYPDSYLKIANNRGWIEFGNSLVMDTYNMSIANTEYEYLSNKKFIYDKLQRLSQELTSNEFFNGHTFSMIDTCYAPLFMRINLLNEIYTNNLLNSFTAIESWFNALSKRPSVIQTTPQNYRDTLIEFLKKKNSYIVKK